MSQNQVKGVICKVVRGEQKPNISLAQAFSCRPVVQVGQTGSVNSFKYNLCACFWICEPLVDYISKLENQVCEITIFFCVVMANFPSKLLTAARASVV